MEKPQHKNNVYFENSWNYDNISIGLNETKTHHKTFLFFFIRFQFCFWFVDGKIALKV